MPSSLECLSPGKSLRINALRGFVSRYRTIGAVFALLPSELGENDGSMPGTADHSRLISFATFQVDPATGELSKQGRKIKLQGQPFELLVLLLEHPGELVTREELKEKIWGNEITVDFDRGLNRAVNKIREALGDSADSPHFIETVPRRGYRFIGTIHSPENTAILSPAAAVAFASVPEVTGRRGSGPSRWLWISVLLLVMLPSLAVWKRRELASLFWQPHNTASQIRSIAVLPLENLSNDVNEEYFADGVTDELITDLANIHGLRVISRTSVMPFKRKRASLSEIASALGVDAVVEGTVSRSNQKVRITAQLIEAHADRHLWAQSYERDLADTLEVQREISMAIAREVQLAMSPELPNPARPAKVGVEAYNEYLKGRFFWDKRTEQGAREAIRHFNRAIELEPSYAAAYAGIADAYFVLCWDLGITAPGEGFPKGKAAALRALQIDPSNSEAHTSLLWEKLWYEWDWAGVEAEAKAAINSNPNYATAHHHYSRYLALMGRFDESLDETRKTLELDPLGPISGGNLAWNYNLARQYAAAERQSQALIDMYPTMPGFYDFLGFAKEQQGQLPEAIKAFQQVVKLDSGWQSDVADLGHAYALSGNRAQALRVIDHLSRTATRTYVPAASFAIVYLGLHEDDEAFKWLERAYAERSPYLVYLKVDPRYDRLRSDRRFVELLRRVGFPQ